MSIPNHKFRLIGLLCIAAALQGCGYHVGGRGSALPPTWHTIAVPAFVNKTHSYKLEQRLTGAVIHEFLGHGGACIVQGCHDLDSSLWPGSAHFHCTCQNAIFFTAGTLVSVGCGRFAQYF